MRRVRSFIHSLSFRHGIALENLRDLDQTPKSSGAVIERGLFSYF